MSPSVTDYARDVFTVVAPKRARARARDVTRHLSSRSDPVGLAFVGREPLIDQSIFG